MRGTGVSCAPPLQSGSDYLVSVILEQVMISLQVFYEGHVQGVGFRYTVRHIAKGFDVTGWVRNLPDGRVELQVTGEENELRAFLDQIAESELHSLIRKQHENKLNEPVAGRGFDIRHD
jgi:acylphosphatase